MYKTSEEAKHQEIKARDLPAKIVLSSFWLDVAFPSRELELVSAAGGQGPSGRIWLCEPSSTNVFLFWG